MHDCTTTARISTPRAFGRRVAAALLLLVAAVGFGHVHLDPHLDGRGLVAAAEAPAPEGPERAHLCELCMKGGPIALPAMTPAAGPLPLASDARSFLLRKLMDRRLVSGTIRARAPPPFSS